MAILILEFGHSQNFLMVIFFTVISPSPIYNHAQTIFDVLKGPERKQ